VTTGVRAGERIARVVTGWAGVTTDVGRFGEVEYLVGGRMIGHVHGDAQADIPYPRAVRDRLVEAGRTGPHHIHPDSGWTTRYIHGDEDADAVVELLRINYDRVTASIAKRSG
jgi:hypothetical protein